MVNAIQVRMENKFPEYNASDSESKTSNNDSDLRSNQGSCTTRRTRNSTRKKNRKKQQHSLDHLRQRVSELMAVFEGRGYFIPQPDSMKGKVWSSRIYGADKKRQRKNAEREMLESRIEQLENHLKDEYGIINVENES